ncbi:hypothetical protein [Butyrivibrio fibrisolvens]|uniref:hypothetical protein n=1 Tax=Butyrivibrio fibrisolvens TaxID=831 RepID=UPI0003B4A679|nr:hypothetical protein [Butyrivibrio fibrisolvens]
MSSREYPFNLLTDYIIDTCGIDIKTKYTVEEVPARSLLNATRFDLMSKWIYIDALETGKGIELAKAIYEDNIRAFSSGEFIEPGKESKNTLDKYYYEFNRIIEDIKENGFNSSESLVPLGCNNEIFDGAHRVSAAAYYNKNITVIRFHDIKPNSEYDYNFFTRYLMSIENMGYMANAYAHIMPNCYMACVWPVADRNKIGMIEDIISEIGKIVYAQDVYLTYTGLRNFMVSIYGHQKWTGTLENGYSGVDEKARACYYKKNPVRTYLFQASSLDDVVYAKTKIRNAFKLENHSIHISDNSQETQNMAQTLYNRENVKKINFNDLYRGTELLSRNDFGRLLTYGKYYIPRAYRYDILDKMQKKQIEQKRFGSGTYDYHEFMRRQVKDFIKMPLNILNKRL